MKDSKFSVIISIIALIISIIALLLNLGILKCHCSCLNRGDDDGKNKAQQEQVVAQDNDRDGMDQSATTAVVEEAEPAPIVVSDQPLKKKTSTAAFIDLGLPSGTKWRELNEPALMTFDEAVDKYGKQLPSQKQYNELYEKCQWLPLKDGGYKVVGPNGKWVIFPLTGFINCTGEFRGEKDFGDYWTSTKKGDGEAWRVVFNEKGVKILAHTSCYARGIRLVEQ